MKYCIQFAGTNTWAAEQMGYSKHGIAYMYAIADNLKAKEFTARESLQAIVKTAPDPQQLVRYARDNHLALAKHSLGYELKI